MMGYYGYGPYWGDFGMFGMVFGVLIWVLVAALIIMIIRRVAWGGRWHHRHGMHGMDTCHNDSAIEILNQRYAKGEINKEEYEEKKKVIIG